MARKVRQPSASDALFGTPVKRSDMLAAIAGDAKKVQTFDDLEFVPSVPTIFPSFNRAVVLGGAPCRATWLIHGPPAGGKTVFALGVAQSFVRAGHAAAYINAEYSLDKKWVKALNLDLDCILLHNPLHFEDMWNQVDVWINNFAKAKKDGIIPQDRAFCIIVDTIHKPALKDELTALNGARPNSGKNQYGAENANNAWGMRRANMIKSWMDHLTPLVYHNNLAFLAIAHEKETKSDNWGQDEYKVLGGQSLFYEAMARVRVEGKMLFTKIPGSEKKLLTGKAHKGEVAKNKVGAPHEFFQFYTSNGKGSAPQGFDLIREAVDESIKRKFVTQNGGWIYMPYEGGGKFNGKDRLMDHMRANPDDFEEFIDELNNDLEDPENYEYKQAESQPEA